MLWFFDSQVKLQLVKYKWLMVIDILSTCILIPKNSHGLSSLSSIWIIFKIFYNDDHWLYWTTEYLICILWLVSVCQWILSLAVHQDSLNTPETTQQQHTQQLDTTCVQDMILFLCCFSQSWAEGRRFSKRIFTIHLWMRGFLRF